MKLQDLDTLWDQRERRWTQNVHWVDSEYTASARELHELGSSSTRTRDPAFVVEVVDLETVPPSVSMSVALAVAWSDSAHKYLGHLRPEPGTRTCGRIVQDFAQTVILATEPTNDLSQEDRLVNQYQAVTQWRHLPQLLNDTLSTFERGGFSRGVVIPVMAHYAPLRFNGALTTVIKTFTHPRVLLVIAAPRDVQAALSKRARQ